jgi:hypothetical protein
MKRVIFTFLLLFPLTGTIIAQSANQGVLSATQIQAVFPATVYFGGQMTTVQMRNAAGVRWNEGKQTLFGMVDAGGYSSGMRDRYQFYILTDVPIDIDGKHLLPGAYGAGFLADQGFEVMDLGGKELFHAAVQHDSGMRRPRPLQVTSAANHYRLYLGRDFVDFSISQ